MFLAHCAADKKAENISVIDARGGSGIADFFVICSASSERAVKALGEHVEKSLREKKIRILDKEGLARQTWILIGTGDVIIHIFHPQAREFYNLEGLWSDLPRVKFEAGSATPL
ncbi:MAG: ribosome silencing factor [Candidatus Dadabacteria bacterium]|nr:ribosome silencing factor [Candidatus Dadabacteria bacterium]